MESVGQKLRDARARLGLTLEQISADTRITIRNLRAIEADELSSISSPFFYRSFVRQFASKVNLEYDSIAAAVQQAASSMPEPRMPGQDEPEWVHVPAIKPKRHWSLRWLRSLVSLSVVIAACTGIHALWQSSHANWHNLVAEIGVALQRVQNNVDGALLPAEHRISAAARLSGPGTPAQRTAYTEPRGSGFHVELSAIERSWLSIVADGKEVFTGVLDAPETKALDGHESARIKTGNAGGLKFTFNGREIGILGPRGQVRTVVFTKDNYEVLPATPKLAFSAFSQNVD
jgi:hypothetical protein